MKRACDINSDFNPISNTIDALNKVARSMQVYRRNGNRYLTNTQPTPESRNAAQTPANAGAAGSATMSAVAPQSQALPQTQLASTSAPQNTTLNIQPPPTDLFASPTTGPSSLNNTNPNSNNAAFYNFPSLQDFNPVGGELQQPLDFIRALENDFIGRNWHETWWDMDGDGAMDLDSGLAGAEGQGPPDPGPDAGIGSSSFNA
jgi:hypothetical protein